MMLPLLFWNEQTEGVIIVWYNNLPNPTGLSATSPKTGEE